MKIEVKETKKEYSFPIILKCNSTGMIVVKLKEGINKYSCKCFEGIVLSSSCNDFKAGDYFNNFIEEKFTVFDGEIVLKNEL